jgi:phosphohistidine swiveling domain-containing protein
MSTGTTMTETVFNPPGPGSWTLDAAHCERPRSWTALGLFTRQATEGLRAGFAEYGVLLDTIEFKSVGPFPYGAARPLGAPPGARRTPPRWLLRLLMVVHPAMRGRVHRAEEVIRTRSWRAGLQEFWREAAVTESNLTAFAAEPIATFAISALADHVERLGAFLGRSLFEHFRRVPLSVIPVGDFIAYATEAGVSPEEAVGILRGHSPASVAAGRALEEAAAAIAADSAARTALAGDGLPEETLSRLRTSPGPVGETVGRLLDRYGDAIVSGHDLTELRLVELPALVIAALRARVVRPADADGNGQTRQTQLAAMRARVPADRRATFDERLEEACTVYPVRDAQASLDLWTLGLLRRALLEAAGRLVAQGKLEAEDDVFDASCEEIVSLCRGGSTPGPADIAVRARNRRASRLADAPLRLGPEPPAPPPAEWLPPASARVTRAFEAYRALLDEPTGSNDRSIVRGVGASPGRATGIARIVRTPADFEKLCRGDVLVAPTTAPTYNVILPLLGGIVTDRGGLLSHAAIVSREYGFPGIVGTRDATKKIPDGAVVELDGTTGTVRVLKV